jgi:hypothetical protein
MHHLRWFLSIKLLISCYLLFGQASQAAFRLNKSKVNYTDSLLYTKCKGCLIYEVDDSQLKNYLNTAPHIDRISNISTQGLALKIPNSVGEEIEYRLAKYDMVEAELYAQFPEIMTFVGKGLDGSTIRADYTSHGFKAWVTGENVNYMIEPLILKDKNLRIVLNNLNGSKESPIKEVIPDSNYSNSNVYPNVSNEVPYVVQNKGINSFTHVRKYRLAVYADSEFTNHSGGTTFHAISTIVSYVNKLNMIFERDMSISFIIVPNNKAVSIR